MFARTFWFYFIGIRSLVCIKNKWKAYTLADIPEKFYFFAMPEETKSVYKKKSNFGGI